ncbi:M23 family metallopeptidase [Bacteroides pyogenes]|uniref:M23 family metallopeptidase n=1 Tax=Bacteroides pyogenes TaxID=310300 RepID=UPI001BA89A11|nr:M23 family metallopeptidase [Bacteroides pyogenes]
MSKTRILISLLLLLSGNHAKAQFNTVSCPGNRYKVVVENPSRTTNETEATPESITSENEKSVPDKVALSSTDTKKKEQVARYLSVCYPLSHIKINSPYGYRKDPFTGKRKFHNGIDLHARSAKVFAMMQGRVLKVEQDKVSGKYITLQHGSFTVSYCHLSQISVSQGQAVLPGDVVGITGNTGRSTGEHLHITCKYKGETINPSIIFSCVRQS